MNVNTRQEVVVADTFHGQRIDSVLAQLFPEFSRSKLTTWLKAGAITVNDQPCKPKDKVRGGELIKLTLQPIEPVNEALAEPIPLDLIFEDETLLVINKPANLVVHPGAGNQTHTLMNALLYHDPALHALPRAGIVHRLDKDTTGLMVVAKTLAAHTSLIRQMQARTIERHYIALVFGHLVSGGLLETGFGRHPRNRLKMAVHTQGKPAITQYALKKQYHDFTLLDVKLFTGRTHQIRVHMAHINHPVVGDPLYGGRKRIPAAINNELRQTLQQFSRQALHACQLSFHHPITQTELTFTASLPDDFKQLLTELDNNYV